MAKSKGYGKGKQVESGKRMSYDFVVYVSGPVYSFEVTGRNYNEAFENGMAILEGKIQGFNGKVEVERIQIEKYGFDKI